MILDYSVLSKYDTAGMLQEVPICIGQVVYRVNGNARNEPEIIAEGRSDFFDLTSIFDENTICGVGSITKQFTAATLLKLWDNELTLHNENITKTAGDDANLAVSRWFPNGMETPLKYFMPALKEYFSNQRCQELFSEIDADTERYPINLYHLLNHTHGLGARNENAAFDVLRRSGDDPVGLVDIVCTTQKRQGEAFGEMRYGNFGYDLVAMIVEAITGKPFDVVVKETILGDLPHTYTQSDHRVLYETVKNVARGYGLDGPLYNYVGEERIAREMPSNITTNTRAAGGFKSTARDLVKFAALYMGGALFQNEAVRNVVQKRDAQSAYPDGFFPGAKTYHVGIFEYKDGSIGHPGDDFIYKSDLRYDPQSGDVSVVLKVEENLSLYILNQSFQKLYPEDIKKIEGFNDTLRCFLKNSSDASLFGSKDWHDSVRLACVENPDGAVAAQRYIALYDYIMQCYSPRDMAEHTERIIQELPDQYGARSAQIWANALDL